MHLTLFRAQLVLYPIQNPFGAIQSTIGIVPNSEYRDKIFFDRCSSEQRDKKSLTS